MTLQSPGAYLQTLAERPFLRSLGLMTGTSMDGLDLALVTVSGDRDLHGDPEWYGFVPFPKRLRQEITQGLDGATSMVADLNYSLGWWMAEAAKNALKNAHLPDPDCIGSHGQTLFHRSARATLQVGEPAFLARAFQVPVVSNFRAMDIVIGGTGAPLIPKVDEWLFRHSTEMRVALNLGGMANVTILPPKGPITGFDTGPGMALLDETYRLEQGKGFDMDGAMAETGTVHYELVDRWLDDEYIQAPPPKSTGRDRYGPTWIAAHQSELSSLSFPDRLATLSRFTAAAIEVGLRQAGNKSGTVIISGSGMHHRRLFQELENVLAPRIVRSSADFGVNPDGKEALGFALLAVAALKGIPANVPSVTGAQESTCLGTITVP